MRVRVCVLIVAGLAVGAVGCSASGSGRPAAADTTTVASPAPLPTAPSAALCAAVRALIAARPTFAGGPTAPTGQEAKAAQDFYTRLYVLFTTNDGADASSVAVASDVARLGQDYAALAAGDTGDVSGDLGALGRDEPSFDTACGIAAIAGVD